jgi:diguanylate cyclase (GGDEF)-like protein
MGYIKTMYNTVNLEAQQEALKEEFDRFKNFSNNTIKILTERNLALEKKLDSLSNIIEISRYINLNISNDGLIPMINDMIIGILGVAYSSIFLKQEDKLVLKATNIEDDSYNIYYEDYGKNIESGEPFVINCDDSPFCKRHGNVFIHSVIGVPVMLGQKFTGYIVVEHGHQDFFTNDHIKFLNAIANQIAIAVENSMLYKKVKEASIKDPMLQIFNRGYFYEFIKGKLDENPDRCFAIVMLDVDNFKKANDIYGHQFGDEALISIANIIAHSINSKDIVARYGGEEIIIYIDEAEDRDVVFSQVEKIREKIDNNIMYHNGSEVRITASFGISYYDRENRDLIEVLKLADTMMYKAKHSGKNIVISI